MVLENPQVQKWLKDPRVVFMQGDWTHPNRHISRFLEKFDRGGIPVMSFLAMANLKVWCCLNC